MDGDSERARSDLSRAQARVLLQSWKEIANHLGVCVRTAQLWQERCGLPVYHEGVGRKRRVVAYSDDLERWREARRRAGEECSEEHGAGGKPETLIPEQDHVPEGTASEGGPQTRHGRRARLVGWFSSLGAPVRFAAISILVVAGVAVLFWVFLGPSKRPGDPAKWKVEGRFVRFSDVRDRFCWEFELRDIPDDGLHQWQAQPQRNGAVWRIRRVLVEDLDADGRPEALIIDWNETSKRNSLLCFNPDGALRWKHQHGKPLSRRGRDFQLAYAHFWTFGPFEDADRRYVLTCAGNTYFPCQMALIDVGTGQVVQEYWHPGGLASALAYDIDRDGRPEVLAAGVNNPDEGPGHPALVVLDIPFRAPRPGTLDQFGNPGGLETKYLLFPRIDAVDIPGEFTGAWLRGITDSGTIQVLVEREPTLNHWANYHLDFDLRVVDLRLADASPEYHRTLERQGVLDHPLTQAEIDSWRVVQYFPTAPDGNSPEVNAFWPSFGPKR